MRKLLLAVLAATCTAQAVTQETRLNHIAQRLVEGIYALRENERGLEQTLQSRGLSPQDAERVVRDLTSGVVSCLLSELRADAADRGQPFAENLDAIERSLDSFGAKAVLRELTLVVEARGPQGEACVLSEMQKAGVTPDALAFK